MDLLTLCLYRERHRDGVRREKRKEKENGTEE